MDHSKGGYTLPRHEPRAVCAPRTFGPLKLLISTNLRRSIGNSWTFSIHLQWICNLMGAKIDKPFMFPYNKYALRTTKVFVEKTDRRGIVVRGAPYKYDKFNAHKRCSALMCRYFKRKTKQFHFSSLIKYLFCQRNATRVKSYQQIVPENYF